MKESMSARTRGITGNTLKIIAIVTMLIDHIGVAIFENGMLKYQDNSLAWVSIANLVLRTIGRIAFPIFCFLLVEGFFHTRDIKKYGTRLFLFALISEIPFDLAVFDTWFYPGYQNVYFTLFIGLWVIYWYDKVFGNPIRQTLVMFFIKIKKDRPYLQEFWQP